MHHSRRSFSVCAVAALALATLAAPRAARAQSETDPGLCRVPATQAIGVSLQIAPVDTQSEFREGEVISLAADYSTGSADTYFINDANPADDKPADNLEVVCVSPNVPSPSDDDGMSRLSAAYGQSVELLANPQHFSVSVNSWHKLKPGTYRVYVESRRIHLGDDPPPDAIESPVVVSNAIQIQVVEASMPWQSQKLSDAIMTLDAYLNSTRDDEALQRAAEDAASALAYLCTEDAAREMARRYGTTPFDVRFRDGLLATPHRDAAAEVMRAEIADPNRPITSEFLALLAELEGSPLATARDGRPLHSETLEMIRERNDDFAKRVAELNAERLNALSAKSPEARAATAMDAVSHAQYPLEEPEKSQLVDAIVSSWPSIDEGARQDLLDRRWALLASTQWLPLLRTIVDGTDVARKPEDFPAGLQLVTGPQYFEPRRDARSLALYHIYEVSPGEGRERILREIAKPSGQIDIGSLDVLPDRELPQLGASLLAGYRNSDQRPLESRLIARYASDAIFQQLRADFESHQARLDCESKPSLLRYFLRVRPEYGIAQVRAAVSGDKDADGCSDLFSELGSEVSRPEIEKLAVAELYRPEAARVRTAANTLSRYGSQRAEAALWQRIEDFHTAFVAAEKDSGATSEETSSRWADESSLEWVVLTALVDGTNWFLTADQIRSLESIAAPSDVAYLESAVRGASDLKDTYFLQLQWDRAKTFWTLGRFRGTNIDSLKVKLAQLPPGTRIFLHAAPVEFDAHPADFRALEDAVHSDGLRLDSFNSVAAATHRTRAVDLASAGGGRCNIDCQSVQATNYSWFTFSSHCPRFTVAQRYFVVPFVDM